LLRFLGSLASRWLEDPVIDDRCYRLAEQFLFDCLPSERSAAIFQRTEGPFGSALEDLYPLTRVILTDAAETSNRQIEDLGALREVRFGRNLLQRRIESVCHLPDGGLPPAFVRLFREHLDGGIRYQLAICPASH
jgi:hypothetical protein